MDIVSLEKQGIGSSRNQFCAKLTLHTVSFASCVRILEECSIIHFPPVHFCFVFVLLLFCFV